MSELGKIKNIETLKEGCEEFLIYLETVRCLSINTVISYRQDLSNLENFLDKEKKISEIAIEDLRLCVGDLSRKKYSAASINRFIASVRGLFSYLKKFNYISHNVSLDLKTIRSPKTLPRFMSQSEIDSLCIQPEKKELLWASRDKAIFEMLYSSGCRVSELASLKFSDFSQDFKSAIITGKGGKDRRIYFEDEARAAFSLYLRERKTKFPEAEINGASEVKNVFINQKGKPLTSHGIWYIVSRYSGIEGTGKQVSPHAFRHTFATSMLNSGADIRIVQELLGHSSISTTQRYTHVTLERLKNIYSQAFPHSGKED